MRSRIRGTPASPWAGHSLGACKKQCQRHARLEGLGSRRRRGPPSPPRARWAPGGQDAERARTKETASLLGGKAQALGAPLDARGGEITDQPPCVSGLPTIPTRARGPPPRGSPGSGEKETFTQEKRANPTHTAGVAGDTPAMRHVRATAKHARVRLTQKTGCGEVTRGDDHGVTPPRPTSVASRGTGHCDAVGARHAQQRGRRPDTENLNAAPPHTEDDEPRNAASARRHRPQTGQTSSPRPAHNPTQTATRPCAAYTRLREGLTRVSGLGSDTGAGGGNGHHGSSLLGGNNARPRPRTRTTGARARILTS